MEELIEQPASIANLVADSDELELLSHLGMQRALTLLFSAKEALYKALYPEVRQFFDFTAVRAVALGECLSLRLAVPWAHWPEGTVIPVRFAFRDRNVFTVVYATPIA